MKDKIVWTLELLEDLPRIPETYLKHLEGTDGLNMKTTNDNILTLDQFKDKNYGKQGTAKRDELEKGYENFKFGALLHEARLEKGLTQDELAKKVGTTKSYISKIENNVKEIRLSTLQKIVEIGLNGRLELSIKL